MATTTHNSTGSPSPTFKSAGRIPGRRLWFTIVFLGLALAANAAPRGPRFVPGRLLVRPRAGLSETNLTAKLNRHGAANRGSLHRLNVRVVNVPEEKAAAALAALRSDPEIEFAERDFIAEAAFAPNDPCVVNGSEWHLARIEAGRAWDFTAGRGDTVVAVLDSGINALQPDLAGRVADGYDFVWNDADPADDFGHGTAVAGAIAAAGNNGTGVAGVAFGCRVLPVKVVDASGFATYSCIAQGIRYAVDQGARVINISIAGASASLTLQDAVNYAWDHNALIVAAAGNNGDNAPQYPAACDHVVAVSATEPDDSLASFSSYGDFVTLSAPGDGIWTTQRDLNNPYGAWRGTSFASPIVAGVAALVASENPSLSNARIVSILEQTADDPGATGRDAAFGYGRVNAFRAVGAASLEPGALPPSPPGPGTTNPPPVAGDTQAPSVTITQSPPDRARLTSAQIELAGMAGDNAGIREVRIEINGANLLADGTTNWSAPIGLVPGVNTVKICSVDSSGNLSAVETRTFTRVVLAPLTVETSGLGAVTPDSRGRLFEIGKVYTLKAVPATGQAFAGWSGAGPSLSPTMSFMMQSNLVLVANFVPSPFPAVKGNYAGLVANTNGVTPESSGCFTLAVTTAGRFTGKLLLGGNRHGFHGQFDLAGNAIVSVKRGRLNPLTLALQLNLDQPADRIAGQLTDGGWVSELAGDRDVFDARVNPAPQAGTRAFILERADDTAITAAAGWSAIASSGTTRVKGKLDDGRAFSAGGRLAGNGDYPFYLSYKRGSEVVIGWLNFPAAATPTASGTVLWVRTGTNAFAATLQAASAPAP